MSARRRKERDRRRRTQGQNFLVDRTVIQRLTEGFEVADGELVVEVGAGTGSLTLPLARAGARVVAVEVDTVWARRVRQRVADAGLAASVRVVNTDFRDFSWPAESYRVVSNAPFGLSTALLASLLDRPDRGPSRADVVLQEEVARKRAAQPPTTLRSAAWAPWWAFSAGERIDRRAFRPVPMVDAALLTIRRREPPVLPTWLAPGLAEALRPAWDPPLPRSIPRRDPRRR
ncbi:MAG TPA: rRNA adenine N-6-methyltransferase family protein [Egibacteraceae bacterium]|nr:rRNA adenine N-6-methyltransferase family protein [Egibacteraceae bacterium]